MAPPIDPTRRRLLRGGLAGAGAVLGAPLLALAPAAAAPLAGFAPRGIHASYTDPLATQRTVTWFTDNLLPGRHALAYQAGEGAWQRVTAQTQRLPGLRGWVHHAAIPAPPGVHLRYQAGLAASAGDAPLLASHAAAPGTLAGWPRGDRLRFTHFGDHGITAHSVANTAAVRARAPDVHFIAGDLSYANGTQSVWDTWFDQLAPLAASVPVMTAPGNHEHEDLFWGSRAYRTRLRQPGPGSYYAFDLGRVHFLALTAGALFAADRDLLLEELRFAAEDLADAAARRARGELDFIVVLQHFTLWTDQLGRAPNDPPLVLLEEPLLVRHRVDLVMTGHDHFYQRSRPMAFGRPDARRGYVQIINGCGGQSLRQIRRPVQPWSAFVLDPPRYCFTEYELDGLTLAGRTFASDGAEPAEVDSFAIGARPVWQRRAAARPVARLAQLWRAAEALRAVRTAG